MAAKKAVTVLKKKSKKPQKAEKAAKKADIDAFISKNKKNSSILKTEKQFNTSSDITNDVKSSKKAFSSIKTSGHLENIGNDKQKKKKTAAKKTEDLSKDGKNKTKQNQSDVQENINSLKRKMNREIFHKCLERKLLHGGEVWAEMDMSSSDEM